MTSENESGSENGSEMVYVEHCKGIEGFDKIVLREACGFSAEVYLYGGQVNSWKTDRGEELLFLSKKAEFQPPKPIRGGIQLCFPEFTFQNHERFGFARNKLWSVDPCPQLSTDDTHNKAYIDLMLKNSEEERRIFPHKYEFRLRVTLAPDGNLILISRIRNVNADGKSFTFSFAYNAHFRVSDVWEVRIEGFETQDYLDNLKEKERFTEQGNSLTFEEEIDRIYLDTPHKIAIMDHQRKRTYVLLKEGLTDAGVWNPWDKKAKAIPDFGKEEYQYMVNVQPARIGKGGVTIKPGEEWKGKLEISLASSSYHSGQLDPLKALKFGAASSKEVAINGASSSSSPVASVNGTTTESAGFSSPVASKGGCLTSSSSPVASKSATTPSSSGSPTASKAGKSGANSSSSLTSKGDTIGTSSNSPVASKSDVSRASFSSPVAAKGGTTRGGF